MRQVKNANKRNNADKIDSVPKRSKKWDEDNDPSNDEDSETSESDDKVWVKTTDENDDSEESESEGEDQLTSDEVVTSESEDVNSSKTELETSNIEEKSDEVKSNEERDQCTVHALRIPRAIKETHIELLFSKFGKVQEVINKFQHRTTSDYDIVYKNREDAVKSLAINGMEYQGNFFIVVKSFTEKVPRNYSVCVKCGAEISNNALWHAFKSCGNIKRIARFDGGSVIITFESIDSVEIALNMGKVTIGHRKLSISKVKEEDILPIQTHPKSTAKVKKAPKQSKKFPKKAFQPSKHHQRAARFNNHGKKRQ